MKYFLLLLLLPQFLFAQPHLSGTVDLNIPMGWVKCDLTINNLPKDAIYTVILNKAFTIKNFKANGKIVMNVETTEVNGNIGYKLHADNDTLQLTSLESLEVEYVGAFPTYQDNEITASDDMGVIAIKNDIIRATSQSVFIPRLLDTKLGQYTDAYTYDLTVHTDKDYSVYLNGCVPQKGKDLHFTTVQPLSFMLYAGNYKIIEDEDLFLLNCYLKTKYVKILNADIAKISTLYYQIMEVPFGQHVVLAQIFTIGPPIGWAFTVTPTIVYNVNALNDQMDLLNGTVHFQVFGAIAHEMGHKYFNGSTAAKNLWHFYSESLAQFLSWKAVEKIYSEKEFQDMLLKSSFSKKQLNRDFVPFYDIEETKKTITNSSYDYYPLYLVAFEKIFGEERCNKLLKQIVINKTRYPINNDYLKRCALDIGIQEDAWNSYSKEILESKNCLPKVMELMGLKK